MFVMYTGRPPPSWLLLLGVVYGVNELFALVGNGTSVRKLRGPSAPCTPCDSSSTGRLFTTRQISNPPAGSD